MQHLKKNTWIVIILVVATIGILLYSIGSDNSPEQHYTIEDLKSARDEISASNYPGCVAIAIDSKAMQLIVTIDLSRPGANESVELLREKYDTLIRIINGSVTVTFE